MHYLLEALVGTLLLGFIVAWAFYVVRVCYPKRARRDIEILSKGLREYVGRYDRIPIIDSTQDEQPADRLMEVLCGAKWAVGKSLVPRNSIVADLNPDGINFIPTMHGRRTINDALVDPWDRPYRFAIGRDFDSPTVISFHDDQSHASFIPSLTVRLVSERSSTVVVHAPFAIWSVGADGINECGYGDDISSWRKRA